MKSISLACVLFTFLCSAVIVAEPRLEVKANDVWVMAGDSITAQRMHSNYIEAFYRTRYPDLNLKFRNSGIGGDTTARVLARFDYDVSGWKPTIVSVELGMNDVGAGDDPKAYIEGMKQLIQRIKAINAQPVLISSSPVNEGRVTGKGFSGRNQRIHTYTEALKKLGQEEGVVVIDQFHALVDLWDDNKPMEEAASIVPRVDNLIRNPAIPGIEHLKAFAKAWADSGVKPVVLGGDPVHPGPVGQYTMAAAILVALGGEKEVSSAALKADGTVVEQKHCAISEAASQDGKLSFTRLDERSPWPISLQARDSLRLLPSMADLSKYTLTVTDLPEGKYSVLMNGKPVAELTNKDLAAGWSMGTLATGVIAERCEQILGQIGNLQGGRNGAWREASKAKDLDKLAQAEKGISETDTKLSEACKPAPIKFEIQPMK